MFIHPLVPQRMQEKLAKVSLWPKCLWPKGNSGQSVILANVSLYFMKKIRKKTKCNTVPPLEKRILTKVVQWCRPPEVINHLPFHPQSLKLFEI